MVFRSAEIRWFSNEREHLWKLFNDLPEKGEGYTDGPRTDLYLRTGLVHTGVKIREGKHEIKIKTARDKELKMGVMEQWIKWSREEEGVRLMDLDHELLDDWVNVNKKRYKKRYIVREGGCEMLSDHGLFLFPKEGCDIEFTEVGIEGDNNFWYTVGLEAYSQSNREVDNLQCILNQHFKGVQKPEHAHSCGYPEWLVQLTINN